MKTLSSEGLNASTGHSWERTALLAGAGYVCLRAAVEFYRLAPLSGALLGKFSWKWLAGYALILGVMFLGLTGMAAVLFVPQWFEAARARLIELRARLGRLHYALAAAIILAPALLLLYTPLGDLLRGAHLRLLILLLAAWTAAFLLTDDERRVVRPLTLILGLALVAGAHLIAERFSTAVDYPFSLGWSEGNRLFNYSLRVDPGRYTILDPEAVRSSASGRSLLWGLPFLIPDTSIRLHRLWDALLWTLPYFALGAALAYRTGLETRQRAAFMLWSVIFLFQGPIYTPLILSALAVVLFVRRDRPVLSAAAAALAGYYAALSRWTWLPAPAAWAVLLLLADFEPKPGEPLGKTARRLLPIALVGLAGLAGGALANARLFSPGELKGSTSLSQPLLWYRLLPNVNYPEGLLIGLLIATLPVVALLIRSARRWNWVFSAAALGAGVVFLAGGLVASVKIGGGNNLHNLDMFLITLALLASLSFKNGLPFELRGWVRPALALAVLLPAWNAVQLGRPLDLPDQDLTRAAVDTIRVRVSRGQRRGEVLFIDQRQLLTFDQVGEVDVIAAYEKKYMMDRAMAGNAAYFRQFYADLAAGRFAMIITEPLFDNVQEMQSGFREENNAWVEWVARPLLCFYAPVETLPEARTQILVPKVDPQGCEAFFSR